MTRSVSHRLAGSGLALCLLAGPFGPQVAGPALAQKTSGAAPAAASAAMAEAAAASTSRASCACRQVEKSRSSRLEMSSIMPARPKRARRPVIAKSVSACTCVRPSRSVRVLMIVAVAPPWPRLSVPRALSTAR